MEQILQQTLTQVIASLLGLAGTYALFLIGKAKLKIAKATETNIKNEAQRKLVQDAFDRITILASNVVAQTQQVSVDALKKAISDGKIDKSELQLLGVQAVDIVYSQLNNETKVLLEQELNDVKGYISAVVESQVLNLKNQLK